MSFKKTIALLSLGKLQGALLMFISRGLIARIIGPEAMGAFTSSTTAMAFASRFLSLGLGPSAQFNSARGKYPLGAVLCSIVIQIVFIACVSTAFLWYGRGFVRLLMFSDNDLAFSSFLAFVPSLTALFVSLGLGLFLLGAGHYREYNRVSVWPGVLFLLAVCLIWFFNYGYNVVLWAQLACWIFGGVLALYYSICKTGKLLYPRKEVNISVFSYGMRAAMVASFTYALNRAAVLFGNNLVSEFELGQYATAALIGEAVNQLYSVTGTVLLSKVSGFSSIEQGAKFTCLVSRISLFILLSFTIVIGVLSPIFIQMIFGIQYYSSIMMLIFLLPGLLANTQQRLLENYLYGRDKQQLVIIPYLIKAIALTSLFPFLSSRYGGSGLAIATTLGHIFALVGIIFIVNRLDNIKVKELWLMNKKDFLFLLNTLNSIFKKKQGCAN